MHWEEYSQMLNSKTCLPEVHCLGITWQHIGMRQVIAGGQGVRRSSNAHTLVKPRRSGITLARLPPTTAQTRAMAKLEWHLALQVKGVCQAPEAESTPLMLTQFLNAAIPEHLYVSGSQTGKKVIAQLSTRVSCFLGLIDSANSTCVTSVGEF